jgi:hypothetical protein
MNSRVQQIRDNIALAQGNIEKALHRSGETSRDVNIVVVTKGQSAEVINDAISAGARILGENYPEETIIKMPEIPEPIEWHMIGHLQRRKSQLVAEEFDFLESLDSLGLAERINRQLIELNKKLPVLIEVNISGEEGKFGFPAWDKEMYNDLLKTIGELSHFPQLTIRGLMVMPPLVTDPEDSRSYFRKTRELRDYLRREFGEGQLSELSMGTSSDYVVAVEEGATIVRLGTCIVGPRPKKV